MAPQSDAWQPVPIEMEHEKAGRENNARVAVALLTSSVLPLEQLRHLGDVEGDPLLPHGVSVGTSGKLGSFTLRCATRRRL